MEIKQSQIYPNSLIFDELDNNQNIYCENDIYREISYNFQESSQNNIPNKQNTSQQQQGNIYSNNDIQPCEKKKEKGKVLHLLKNFTQEMKVRWNMSDVEIRIHNFLDENQVYITDPMQKQFDYYQKTKSQIISSILISNHSSDEDDCKKDVNKNRKDSDFEALGQVLDQFDSSKYAQYHNHHGDMHYEENEEERGLNINGSRNRQGHSNTMIQSDSATTMTSINSQLSLQSSSILAKRKQRNSIVLQTPQSLVQQDNNYEQQYYN